MVSEFMDHRVTDFVNDFFLRSAESQDGPSIDRDPGRQPTGWLEERRLIDRDPLIQTQQIVFRFQLKILQNSGRRFLLDNKETSSASVAKRAGSPASASCIHALNSSGETVIGFEIVASHWSLAMSIQAWRPNTISDSRKSRKTISQLNS